MKKLILAVVVSVFILASLSLPVYAMDVIGNVGLREAYVRAGFTGDDWRNAYDWANWDRSTGLLKIYRNSIPEAANIRFGGLRAKWSLDPFLSVEPGYYLNVNLQFYDIYQASSNLEHNPFDFLVRITLSDGSVHSISPYSLRYDDLSSGQTRWVAKFTARFGGDQTLNIQYVEFETSLPSGYDGTAAYNLYTSWDLTPELTLEQKNHQELITTITGAAQDIIDNADENTQDIIDNADENTDEIVGALEDQTNEDFGYEQDPNKAEVDADVESLAQKISGLSDDIDQSVTDFAQSVSGINDYIQRGSHFVWGWLDIVPSWLVAIISGFSGLLIARKIVK